MVTFKPNSSIISLVGIAVILGLSALVILPLQNQAFAASSAGGPGYTQCSPVNTAVSWTPFGSFSSGLTFVQFGRIEIDSALENCESKLQNDLSICRQSTIGEGSDPNCVEDAYKEYARCLERNSDRAFEQFLETLPLD